MKWDRNKMDARESMAIKWVGDICSGSKWKDKRRERGIGSERENVNMCKCVCF